MLSKQTAFSGELGEVGVLDRQLQYYYYDNPYRYGYWRHHRHWQHDDDDGHGHGKRPRWPTLTPSLTE